MPLEMAAARAMFDVVHADLPQPPADTNAYAFGSIGAFNVVVACLPKGEIGTHSAAIVATRMTSTFRSVNLYLMIGVGGGVPSRKHDIRLGDVVVGTPSGQFGGVVQYDFGKSTKDGFERTGSLNSPPTVVKTAISKLESAHQMEGNKVLQHLEAGMTRYPMMSATYARGASLQDVLFKPGYTHRHNSDQDCQGCDAKEIVNRAPRKSDIPAIHYGLIASGNRVIKNGVERDHTSKTLGDVLCFEMEAAGLINTLPCIVIRGICDYADSHKNKKWQGYAAATAAAYAKELLSSIPTQQLANTPAEDSQQSMWATYDSSRVPTSEQLLTWVG